MVMFNILVFSFSSKEDSVSSLEVKIKASFLTTKQAFNLKKHCVKKRDNSIQYCDKGDNYLETTLLLILDSCHYEVRMIGLVYLHGVSSDEELGEELVFNCVVRPVEQNVATNIKLYLRYY
jgi:hypothetical protein